MRQVLVVTVITLILGCAGQVGPKQQTETRDAFRAKVLGRTEGELLETIGTPDRTSQTGNVKSWTWKERTHDPVTGKVDTSVSVIIEGNPGKVTTVQY